jgi:Ran-binding protein 3
MADTSGQHESATELTPAAAIKPAPTSPARSDKSSDSEGKPVRDKLKETRIDAQGATDPAPGSDQHMEETSNGSANAGEQSTSGSDSDRGRLRRKRSREDFEDETGADNQSEKKQENIKGERHHTRKRSRDVKDIESGLPLKPSAATVERIEENDGDEQMISPKKDTSKSVAVKPSTDISPKNKRTRDQVEEGAAANSEPTKDAAMNGKPSLKAEDERESKRPRDKEDAQPAAKPTESTSKVRARDS